MKKKTENKNKKQKKTVATTKNGKSTSKTTKNSPKTVKGKQTTCKNTSSKGKTTKKVEKKTSQRTSTPKKTENKTNITRNFLLRPNGIDKEGNQKFTAIRVYNRTPKGWKDDKGATTAPIGYKWVHNGKSLLSGDRRSALVKVK